MKLIIVGWNYLINPIITAKNHFEILGNEVYFLPLLQYNIKFSGEVLYDALYSFIQNIDPDVILWWNWECDKNVMKNLKINTPNIIHCLFNWDHPFCLSEWDNNTNRQITSKNIWDIVFVTGDCNLDKYIKSGSSEAYYLRMFADEEIHYPEKDPKYECDVSIVCTSLYENKSIFSNQLLDRTEMITNLINAGLNVKIYGPEHFKSQFPDQYSGFAHFMDNHKIFSNGKVNICTHGVNGYKYCNERVGTILSSGGLLFCDKVDGIEEILTDGKDCILIDEQNYVSQVRNIVENYDKYSHIKQNAIKTAKKKFNPETWCSFINEKILLYKQKNIKKYPNKNVPRFTFKNYQKNKFSIVMTCYNRIDQLMRTLNTIQSSSWPKELIEVICYDDRSEKEPCILDTSKYTFNIKIIYAEFERDPKIINPTYAYNNAFKYITGEYVIIQNSECMHMGDILTHAAKHITKSNMISYPCWATYCDELSEELFQKRDNHSIVKTMINNEVNWEKLDLPKNFRGWYNEKTLRPECLHFCNAMHIEVFKNIGVFNTQTTNLLGFDDNDWAQRAMFWSNLDIFIPDHNYELFVVHQYHGKHNIPRPTELFLESYNKYRKISNTVITNFNNSDNPQNINVLDFNYSDICLTTFEDVITTNSTKIINVYAKKNDIINIPFVRKYLRQSNFRFFNSM